jgi:hypothetical protein
VATGIYAPRFGLLERVIQTLTKRSGYSDRLTE